MLNWLEGTLLARLMHETVWFYPITLSSHAVGMAVLAGLVLMLNFRFLGYARSVPLSALYPLVTVSLWGLLINLSSGTLLFIANANSLFVNNPFRIKVILLVVGGVTFWLIIRRLRVLKRDDEARVDTQDKAIAVISIVAWIGVVVSGRLIAYMDTAIPIPNF